VVCALILPGAEARYPIDKGIAHPLDQKDLQVDRALLERSLFLSNAVPIVALRSDETAQRLLADGLPVVAVRILERLMRHGREPLDLAAVSIRLVLIIVDDNDVD
jgi:hypothetical protein